MIDAAAYRANEINAKRAIASWRLSNINDPYIFQNQGFPVRADSFLDLAQILDTMQEGRFDYYMKELGGFSDEDAQAFVKVCLDYIDFYCSFFQRDRVVVPLSTLISHFVIYKKLIGFRPGFRSLLELGPGCGYLSFFLRNHQTLADYTQIESTESFYLLQSHINAHVFGSAFAEHAVSRHALDDHGAYIPKLKWHNPFHYEDQKFINVEVQPVCNHYPWWRIGEVANRRYDLVTSNANLNEFSREALFQYLSLIRDVLADDGAIVAQCLGGGPPTYDSIFANMKSAGFVPVALVQIDNVPGRTFVVSNGVFVGEKHPLYEKYANVTPQFPMLDRSMDFVNQMYFLNEEPLRKRIYSISDVLHAILAEIESPRDPATASQRRGLSARVPNLDMEKITSSARAREVSRIRRVALLESPGQAPRATGGDWDRPGLTSKIAELQEELRAVRASRSWKITRPLRSAAAWMRQRMPSVLRLIRWLRR